MATFHSKSIFHFEPILFKKTMLPSRHLERRTSVYQIFSHFRFARKNNELLTLKRQLERFRYLHKFGN